MLDNKTITTLYLEEFLINPDEETCAFDLDTYQLPYILSCFKKKIKIINNKNNNNNNNNNNKINICNRV